MRRTSLTPLGETEMEVLHHVWELGEATVAEVLQRITRERPVAYTTVMTVMKKLAEKGFLRFDADGATYVYSPARTPDDVRRELVEGLVDKVFLGSRVALVQTLIRGEDLPDRERAEILAIIERLGRDEGGEP